MANMKINKVETNKTVVVDGKPVTGTEVIYTNSKNMTKVLPVPASHPAYGKLTADLEGKEMNFKFSQDEKGWWTVFEDVTPPKPAFVPGAGGFARKQDPNKDLSILLQTLFKVSATLISAGKAKKGFEQTVRDLFELKNKLQKELAPEVKTTEVENTTAPEDIKPTTALESVEGDDELF